jgi:hypothetical protein
MAVEYINTGSDDGSVLGQSTSDKIAFYNTTPVVQPTNASQAAVGTASATTTSAFGFATSTQADAIVTLVNRIRTDLVALGLIKGS